MRANYETIDSGSRFALFANAACLPVSLETTLRGEVSGECHRGAFCAQLRGRMDVFAPLLECPSSLPEIGLLRLPCETRMHLHIQPPCVSLHPIQEALIHSRGPLPAQLGTRMEVFASLLECPSSLLEIGLLRLEHVSQVWRPVCEVMTTLSMTNGTDAAAPPHRLNLVGNYVKVCYSWF